MSKQFIESDGVASLPKAGRQASDQDGGFSLRARKSARSSTNSIARNGDYAR